MGPPPEPGDAGAAPAAASFALPPRRGPPPAGPPREPGDAASSTAAGASVMDPLPTAVVDDASHEWLIGGRPTALCSDDAFAAAFASLDPVVCPAAWRPVTRARCARFAGLAPEP